LSGACPTGILQIASGEITDHERLADVRERQW